MQRHCVYNAISHVRSAFCFATPAFALTRMLRARLYKVDAVGLFVQSYTINGQKVAFLRRRAVPKEARVGPMCVTCYRSLQVGYSSRMLRQSRTHPGDNG